MSRCVTFLLTLFLPQLAPGTWAQDSAPPQLPATQLPATQLPATQLPATPSPATPSPATPSPATPSPATPSPATTLDRFEPLSPQRAMDSFDVADGFRMELVASEPLVVDPVAFCFDEAGRMIVVEMRGYSERSDDHMGRIRRLSDTNGDGVMDQGETLAEGLSWPTAVECFQEGVIVATAPEVLHISTAGKWMLCTGFGKGNVQGLVNSLRYGLDLRLHGATSSSGAEILGLGHIQPFRLGGRDFAIDFTRQQLSPTNGGAQHGMMIDAWGDKYVCSNSDHLQQVLMTPTRSHRAASLSFEPPSRRSIAADGPQAEVFRASPVEPWRILRTHLRVTGQASGPIEGGGRAAGYFTGATGVWIYEDDQWPAEEYPIAVVCDVGSNLVHRKHLIPDGLFNIGKRIDQDSELVRSTDTWFRPVQLGNGPDGALYIADMYREVIEHPKSLPPIIKSQVDLNSGNDRGRIWRLVSTQRPLHRKHLDLSTATPPQLVAAIDSENSWQRRTAARLIYEKYNRSVNKALADVATGGQFPQGRLQALATLLQLSFGVIEVQNNRPPSKLLLDTLISATKDNNERIRQRAIEMLASLPNPGQLVENGELRTLASDPSLHVRFQLAYEAAALFPRPKDRAKVLYQIARQDPSNNYIRWAVEGSLQAAAGSFLKELTNNPEPFAGDEQVWLTSVLFQTLRQQESATGNSAVTDLISLLEKASSTTGESKPSNSPLWDTLWDTLWNTVVTALDRLPRNDSNKPLATWIQSKVLPELLQSLSDGKADARFMAEKLALVRWAVPEQAQALLRESLSAGRSVRWKQLAIEHLAGFDGTSTYIVSEELGFFTPQIQQVAVDRLALSKSGQARLLAKVISETIPLEMLPKSLQSAWLGDSTIAERLPVRHRNSKNTNAKMEQVLEIYLAAFANPAESSVGAEVFKKNCATCHKVDADGQRVGPDLKSVIEKGPEQILLAIIDPNREVDPKYRTVKVLTDYGKLISGIVADESDSRLRIVDVQGISHQIERAEIETLETTSKSLMPEGLHEAISPTEMNDLILYLRTSPRVEP